MAAAKKDWDEIPSLEGLSVDWEFEPKNPLGKRGHVRMNGTELAALFSRKQISVKIATEKHQHSAKIIDLCEGGVAVDVQADLPADRVVVVGFFLGKKKIVNRAMVKWGSRKENSFQFGMMFVNMKEEDSQFISGVYASQKINRY